MSTTISSPVLPAPALVVPPIPTPAIAPPKKTWARSIRTIKITAKVLNYLRVMGCRQVCWVLDAMQEHGHYRSRCEQIAVDKEGQPLPWYTYPIIEFLRQLDFSDRDVFEFGAGNSSLFWAGKARSVVSVESDAQWCQRMHAQRRPNQQIIRCEDLDQYPSTITRQDRKFDIIAVDGKRRLECARAALGCLIEGGMIVLDNSDWHPKTAALLREAGLIQIDFTGFGPVNNYAWTTTLYLHPAIRLKPCGARLPEPGVASLKQIVE